MLNDDTLKDIPLLILSNKQDLPNEMPLSSFREVLRLDALHKMVQEFKKLVLSG
jgi:signal recognition particle receptor subunit beta